MFSPAKGGSGRGAPNSGFGVAHPHSLVDTGLLSSKMAQLHGTLNSVNKDSSSYLGEGVKSHIVGSNSDREYSRKGVKTCFKWIFHGNTSFGYS